MNRYFLILTTLLIVLISSPTSVLADEQYTVVIDAGHGGKDYGAIDNSVNEKDVNLGVALKLGERIKKKHKNIKVVYTRDKDTYLTLQERADKANKAKGDLFISIHTNSVDKSNPNRKTVEGASTYTLGLHKNDNNMAVARRENAVMTLESNYESKYKGFDPNSDESYIIFEMAQKANLSQSARFASAVQKQMKSIAGRKDRGVHQAGFWVLWATSMPSVLIELDFICNPTSAKFISSDKGQAQMADAICEAVGSYFSSLNKYKNTKQVSEEDVSKNKDVDAVISVNVTSRKTEKPEVGELAKANNATASRRRRSESSRHTAEKYSYEKEILVEDLKQSENLASVPAEKSQQSVQVASENKSSRSSKGSSSAKSSTKAVVNSSSKATAKVTTKNTSTTLTQNTEKKTNVKASGTKSSTQKAIMAGIKKESKEIKTKNNTATGSVAKLSKRTNVYKVQVYTSTELLKASNEVFHGLYPINCFKDGDLYTYTYGETESKQEIYKILETVREKIPDAVVVKKRK